MDEQWVSAGPLSSLPEGELRTIDAEDVSVVIVKLGGEVFALDDQCPHQGGPLGRGELKEGVIWCPWHCWQFDARTGRPVWPESNWRATRYPVKIEDGQILVRVG